MNLPTVVSTAAEQDLQAAFEWYETQRVGLGLKYLSRIQDSFGSISERPMSFPIVHRDTRRALVRKFPYAVYYIIEQSYIDIVAVIHTRQHPRRWLEREP